MNKKAEHEFKNILIGFILLSLFGMLLLTAVTQSGNTYGKNLTEVTGGSLSLSKFNQSVSDVESHAQALKERFDKGSVWSSIAGVVVEGVFGIAKDMATMILTPFDLIWDLMTDTLHIPAFVSGVILGILIFAIIFGIWSLIKIGT